MKTLALLLFLAPRIVQHSMGGDLTVDYAPNGATLRTMGGDIRIARSNCLVIAKTMGGNVEVEVAGNGSGRSIEAWSMGGELELTVPRGFAANFDVVLEQDEDRDHRIVSDIPLHIVETTHRRWFHDVRVLHATSGGAANGNRVYLKTIGGEIRIRTQ